MFTFNVMKFANFSIRNCAKVEEPQAEKPGKTTQRCVVLVDLKNAANHQATCKNRISAQPKTDRRKVTILTYHPSLISDLCEPMRALLGDPPVHEELHEAAGPFRGRRLDDPVVDFVEIDAVLMERFLG